MSSSSCCCSCRCRRCRLRSRLPPASSFTSTAAAGAARRREGPAASSPYCCSAAVSACSVVEGYCEAKHGWQVQLAAAAAGACVRSMTPAHTACCSCWSTTAQQLPRFPASQAPTALTVKLRQDGRMRRVVGLEHSAQQQRRRRFIAASHGAGSVLQLGVRPRSPFGATRKRHTVAQQCAPCAQAPSVLLAMPPHRSSSTATAGPVVR